MRQHLLSSDTFTERTFSFIVQMKMLCPRVRFGESYLVLNWGLQRERNLLYDQGGLMANYWCILNVLSCFLMWALIILIVTQ